MQCADQVILTRVELSSIMILKQVVSVVVDCSDMCEVLAMTIKPV